MSCPVSCWVSIIRYCLCLCKCATWSSSVPGWLLPPQGGDLWWWWRRWSIGGRSWEPTSPTSFSEDEKPPLCPGPRVHDLENKHTTKDIISKAVNIPSCFTSVYWLANFSYFAGNLTTWMQHQLTFRPKFTMYPSHRVLQLLPSGHVGKQQQSQLSLFSSPPSPPTSTRLLKKTIKRQLKWADVCAQASELAEGEVRGAVDTLWLDRMLLSLFSDCDLH